VIDREDVTLLAASLVKGLEFDCVIVVEPADIVAAEPRGTSRLTRAVAGLLVLRHGPLPPPPDHRNLSARSHRGVER